MNEQHAAVAAEAASLVLGPALAAAEEPSASALTRDAEPAESEPPSPRAPCRATLHRGWPQSPEAKGSLKIPLSGVRHPHWKDVPDELWEDWRWQRQHAVRSATQLAELLALPPEEVAALELLESKYRTAIPPYYFSLIDADDPDDPIRVAVGSDVAGRIERLGGRARRSAGRRPRFARCRASRIAIPTGPC